MAWRPIAWLAAASAALGGFGTNVAAAALPENLALQAQVSASSEYSNQYLAKFAVDGRVPPAGSQGADLEACWCVRKEQAGDRGEFRLAWPAPIEVAEIVYYGRTSWYLNECWKDYEVYLDGAATPAVRGSFQMLHGPQRIRLPAGKTGSITLKFLNSFGGFNPGAAEIQVFGRPAAEADLTRYLAQQSRHASLAIMPWIDQHDPADVRRLIEQLRDAHGPAYRQATAHLARLEALHAHPDDAALELLEREALLFDVDRLAVIKRHEITASHVYTYHYEGFRAGGGLYTVSVTNPAAAPRELVASPAGQILDLDLSYDGQTILFSWRRQEDEGYHLWTIGVDGRNLRQLTRGAWHDYNACWLPDGGIAFLSTRAPQFAYCWHAPVGVLHRMNADGSATQRLSANYLNDFTPSVLEDGRILYTRWEYVDRPAIPIQSLWTINPDGTGLAGYFGNRVLSPGTFMESRSIPGTTRIICTMTGHNGPTRGALGVIDRARGVNAQQAIENITPDVHVPAVNQGNGNTDGSKQYSCPLPLDGLRILCSIRGPVLARTLDGRSQSVALDAPKDGMQWFSATPLRRRARGPAIPSTLTEKTDRFATVFLQDVHQGLAPQVARGEIQRIRVVREMEKTVRIDPSLRAFGFQFPVISCGATYAGKEVLGEVPVEADGSACFRVPAGVPIYFMALDAQGQAVQRMRSFTHFMPGEVQGCIGCHEHRAGTARPQLVAACGAQPRELEPPEWSVRGFDYARIVQPVLDRHCAECHGGVAPDGGLDLTGDKTDFFNVSYEMLARQNQGRRGSPLVSWIPTYNGQEWNILEITPKAWGSPASRLAEIVLSGHPDAAGQPRVAMDEASRRRVLAWIDLNVPYYGSSETAWPDKPGCRQLYPPDLDRVLAAVAARRCGGCHAEAKVPRREWVRIEHAELNPFLLAPLARAAGGSQRCGQAVFADTSDPDYQAILATFEPVTAMLQANPRMDMPGAKPSCDVSRSCQ